jgi:hypothetical protein
MKELQYLLGDTHFTVRTDHKNLTYIRDSGKRKAVDWKLELQEFNYDIEHIEGKANIAADYFSRHCADGNCHCLPANFIASITSPPSDEPTKLLSQDVAQHAMAELQSHRRGVAINAC